MATVSNLMHEALARSSSESSSEEIYNGRKSRPHHPRTGSCTGRNRNHKSSDLGSTKSTSDTDSGRKAQGNRGRERLNVSESDFDHSNRRADYDTYEKGKALKVISPMNDRYNEALGFCTKHLASTSSRYGDQVVRNVAKLESASNLR